MASPSPEKPFQGYRIVVKDCFDVRGIRTSIGSRAYLDLYPPASSTALCLQSLVDGGAEILGKTKLSMFLSREEPSESVDFQTAWNPRGDGYQGPGGSSNGSAVAVVAYDWVDIGIGSDSKRLLIATVYNNCSHFEAIGSIRRPAQCCGCFGLRPSSGALSQDGLFTSFR